MKFGGQYNFDFGLTVSYLYEDLHRDVPPELEFQNERQRNGMWFSAEQAFNDGRDVFAVGWAHAGATVGDPGGQHNFNPNGIGDNQANMYAFECWHKLDKQLTMYFDAAETINDGNAHYDIGAGGHGIKTDCHDATHDAVHRLQQRGPDHLGRLPSARLLDRGELYVLSPSGAVTIAQRRGEWGHSWRERWEWPLSRCLCRGGVGCAPAGRCSRKSW